MTRANSMLAGCLLMGMPVSAAQAAESFGHAVGTDLFVSTDADDTDVVKGGINLDWRFKGPELYQGIRLERARFKPLGGPSKDFDRVYLRYGDRAGHWAWTSQVGTDGHTALGSATVHDDARFRKEFFLERDILETPQGIHKGIYYTFGGGALDLPINDRNTVTVVAGLQAFTGKNERLHLRGIYTHVVKPDWGLSVQLRGRYFHSSHPGEYDYFSPRWYSEVLPVVQLRRYSGGWRYSVAAGIGAQRDSGSDWRSSRYVNAQVTSPAVGRHWFVKAGLVYSNTPVGSGYVYDYTQFN
ncbi:MAG TPA: hypothetical protein VJ859_10630, partial [Allosphingosinicella sp.]|nr:hypothetical protein [Allosphingosinicella sp.]